MSRVAVSRNKVKLVSCVSVLPSPSRNFPTIWLSLLSELSAQAENQHSAQFFSSCSDPKIYLNQSAKSLNCTPNADAVHLMTTYCTWPPKNDRKPASLEQIQIQEFRDLRFREKRRRAVSRHDGRGQTWNLSMPRSNSRKLMSVIGKLGEVSKTLLRISSSSSSLIFQGDG